MSSPQPYPTNGIPSARTSTLPPAPISLTTSFPYSEPARKDWESLSSIAELIEPKAKNREEFIKECQSGAFNGVVAAYKTFASKDITGRFDEELVKQLPESWKFICNNGMWLSPFEVGKAKGQRPRAARSVYMRVRLKGPRVVMLLLALIPPDGPSVLFLRTTPAHPSLPP